MYLWLETAAETAFDYFHCLSFKLQLCAIPQQRNCDDKIRNSAPLYRHWGKGKGKGHPLQALRLCTGRTAHRGSRGTALPFHDHGTRRGGGVSVTPRPLFTPGKDPLPIVLEAGWDPGPVWTGAENLEATGIRSPDRPARSQSLYRLSYRAYDIIRGALLIFRRLTSIIVDVPHR